MSCNCNDALQNLGVRECDIKFKELYGIIFVPTFDSSGARNKIASGDTLNVAYFQDLINNADASKRWYPVTEFENVDFVRAEDEIFTTERGSKYVVQDGIRSFMGKLFNWSARMTGKLNSIKCSDVSVFLVDIENTLIGKYDGTDLYPIRLNKNTFNTLFTWAKSKQPQDITVKFEFSRLEKDEDLRGIKSLNMDNVDFSTIHSLIDVHVVPTSPLATSVVVTLTTDVDEFGKTNPIVGWVATDFKITKSNVNVPILTCTEGADGVYTLTYATSTGSHVVSKSATKLGYEMPDSTFVIA